MRPTPPSSPQARPARQPLLLLGLTVLGVVLLGASAAVFVVTAPAVPRSQRAPLVLLDIERGSSVAAIAHRLQAAGLLRSPLGFVLLARATGVESRLKAGEYELSGHLSPFAILRLLELGKVKLWWVTVPEGLTYWDTAELFGEQAAVRKEEFEAACREPRLLAELGVPAADCEGFLFPETYGLPRTITAEGIVRLMFERFSKSRPADLEARAERLGLSLYQAVTLASLIEREAATSDERSLISAVYHNRLRLGMPLQCDPTVIYALGPGFDGDLRRHHLLIDSPYNSYLYPGLPPGPIASPGRASLEAAVSPAAVDYLYFVSRNDGSHHFSRTLAEHNQAVRRYQQRRRGTGGEAWEGDQDRSG